MQTATPPVNADFRVLTVLAGLCGHHRKLYCYPAQATIVQLLRQRVQRTMSRRTLNRHLAYFEAHGWIKRQRRHIRGAAGFLEMHSTLYSMTRKTLRYLHDAAAGLLHGGLKHPQVLDSSAVSITAQNNPPRGNHQPGGRSVGAQPPPDRGRCAAGTMKTDPNAPDSTRPQAESIRRIRDILRGRR